jgi:hypothetical protein
MENISVPIATLEKLEEVLSDEFINSTDMGDADPMTQLLVLCLHQREILEMQGEAMNETKDKQLLIIDYLTQLSHKYPQENLPVLLKELEQDYKIGSNDTIGINDASGLKSHEQASEDESEDQQQNEDYEAMQKFQDVEHSFENNHSSSREQQPRNKVDSSRRSTSKVKIDQVLAKVAYGDQEMNDTHLLENPNTGEIEALNDPVTHTYSYREISSVVREQQHTIADFMYKLFLVSINFAKVRQAKSYPVFKSLLNRVRINS